jgi:hypothetical protein
VTVGEISLRWQLGSGLERSNQTFLLLIVDLQKSSSLKLKSLLIKISLKKSYSLRWTP